MLQGYYQESNVTEWEKIPNKSPVSRIYLKKKKKHSYNSTIRTQRTQFFKCAKYLSRHFLEKDIQMACKQMKRHSINL